VKWLTRAKRLQKKYNTLSIIGNVAKYGYKLGRASKGTLRGRRIIRGVKKFGDSKVGSATLKVGGFVAKHPVGVKRLWKGVHLKMAVEDFFDVDSKEVREMEDYLR
jgi:hypothetical protein